MVFARHRWGSADSDSTIKEFQQQIARIPLLQGTLVEGIQLTSGETKVFSHGLGRKYKGYIVTRINKDHAQDPWDAELYLAEAESSDPAKFLYLYSNTTTLIDIWIF